MKVLAIVFALVAITHASPCDSNPCVKGMCLTSADSSRYICMCPSHRGGTNCEIILIDPCLNNPCHNGGTCQQEADGGYSCECNSQFGGAQCLQQMTCSLNPCKNGGSCYLNFNDGINYMCKCPDNYKGKDCSKPDPCSSNPCSNNRMCLTEEDGSYSCLCRCGTDGSCSTNNEQDPFNTTFMCPESTDYFGCLLVFSEMNKCNNRGCCSSDLRGGAKCSCWDGYGGNQCQVDCVSSPNGCSSSDENAGSENEGTRGTEGAGTGGAGTGTSGTGTNGEGVRTQVEQAPVICADVPLLFPIVECGRVWVDTGMCSSNQGCCSVDEDGDARCRCNDGFGGPHCEFNCTLDPDGCGTAN